MKILDKEGDYMDAARSLREFTIEDIYALPEGQRAELIDGQLYMMASPTATHQRLLLRFGQKIANYIDSKGGDCEVFMAPFAVFLRADDSVYLEPDVSVICDKNKIEERGCVGAPDWIIEITSPSNASHDYLRKLNLYMNSGVREYWIVDHSKNRITVYNFETNDVNEYTFQDSVKTGIYDDFEIDFATFNL